MPAKHQTVTVYPDPTDRAVCGQSSGALNESIAWVAARIKRAHRGPLAKLKREDWNLLADVLNGTIFDGDWSAAAVVASVEDGHSLEGLGGKWYAKNADARIGTLVQAIKDAGDDGAWAIATAVRFFWDRPNEVDLSVDEWWSLPFRVRFFAKGG
jgi:hypothetical protein